LVPRQRNNPSQKKRKVRRFLSFFLSAFPLLKILQMTEDSGSQRGNKRARRETTASPLDQSQSGSISADVAGTTVDLFKIKNTSRADVSQHSLDQLSTSPIEPGTLSSHQDFLDILDHPQEEMEEMACFFLFLFLFFFF
jgi:hypothetical protein